MGLHTNLAGRARVIAVQEATDYELTGCHRRHLVADGLDDSHVLVPDWGWLWHRLDAAVTPQVGPAYACCDGPNDGVGGLLDPRIGTIFDADVAGTVNDC